jgi:DNA polymerase III alpha subunit (gram-positive type)
MFQRANPTNARNYKPILLGQNLIFDIGYLQHMAVYCKVDLKKYLDGDIDFYGNFQPNYFDTLHLGKVFFAPDDKTTSHKLGLMSNKLDVELVNAHDAMADVEATSGIFTKFMNSMRSSGGGGDNNSVEKARDHFEF